MKKILSIVICSIFYSLTIQQTIDAAVRHDNNTEQVRRIVDVTKQVIEANKQIPAVRELRLVEQLQAAYPNKAFNKNIALARMALDKATQCILELRKRKEFVPAFQQLYPMVPTIMTFNKSPQEIFALYVIQSCYAPIAKESLSGMLSKSLEIKVDGSAAESEPFKLQVIEILNRISILWEIASRLFFNGNQSQSMELKHPAATLKIKDWIAITNAAAENLYRESRVGREANLQNLEATTRAQLEHDLQELQTRAQAELKANVKKSRANEAKATIANFQAFEAQERAELQQKITGFKAEERKVIDILQEEAKDLATIRNLKEQALRDLESKPQIEKEELKNLIPTAPKLNIAEKLITSFEKCKDNHTFTHQLFEKNQIQIKIDYALTNLKQILNFMKNSEDKSIRDVMQQKEFFINHINAIYKSCFKKEMVSYTFVGKYLIIKHQFTDNQGQKLENLPEAEAVQLLANLIMLWKIYQNLFDTQARDTIKLDYFDKQQTVTAWIQDTQNAGFNKKAQFSSRAEMNEPSALDVALDACLPKNTEPSTLQTIASKVGAGLNTVGTNMKLRGQYLGRGLSKAWSDMTHSEANTPDTL